MTDRLPSPGKTNNNFEVLGLIFALLMGGFIRLIHVITADFPLNDGGVFYQIILDILGGNYRFPEFITYNLNHIPFAYPPLAFYTGALLSDIFAWPVLDVIRLLPAITSLLTIPAFFLLCRRILPTTHQRIFATFAFTFLPTAFDWLIVGAGLTRSFGYLFAILTLHQVHALYTTRQKRHIFLSILFASLTILSHPGTAWFAAYSSLVIFLFHHRAEKGWLQKSFLVGLGCLFLIAPWLLALHTRHGLAVLAYPFQTEGSWASSILIPFTFLFTNEPLLDFLAIFGLLGVFASLRDRKFFLPVWLLSVFIFESRLGPTYAVLPMALLIGVGLDTVLRQVLTPPNPAEQTRVQKMLPIILVGYLFLYGLIAAYIAPTYGSVSAEQIAALAWTKANTPESSRFLVVTGQPEYGIDYVSEWFPALTNRFSLTTPQAHEWLPNQEFTRRTQYHADLQACASREAACIETWATQNKVHFTHIYAPKYDRDNLSPAYKVLTGSLKSAPEFELLFEGPGGAIFEQR